MMKKAVSVLSLCLCLMLGVGGVLLPPGATVHAAETKIALSPSMVTNESGLGDATLLVDEQTTAGDPANGTGGAPATSWQAGWNTSLYPAHAYIDLGQPYDLTSVYLRDTYDVADITISAGSPGSWTALFTDPLTGWMSWNAHPVSVTTRYVRVSLAAPNVNMAEIVLYGTPAGGGGADVTAPAAVTDLAVSATTSGSATLTWTAPGDDGAVGTAFAYDVRYSTSAITAGNWASATQASGEPAPIAAGGTQTMTVAGLAPGTTYYFALKTTDEAANESGLSNCPSAATLPSGDKTAPAAIKTLKVVSWTADSVTLGWTATGDDGSAGQAASYEVRYGERTIADEKTGNYNTWNTAAVFPQTLVPKPSGQQETLTVTGLLPGMFYSFNVRAKDEAGNASDLSTSVSVRTDWTPASASAGMLTEWYEDMTFGTFRGRTVLNRFEWQSWVQPNEVGAFSFRATAAVTPAYSQTYTFYTRGSANTGVRLWVDGQLLIDTWNSPTAAEQSAQIALTANRAYEIRAEMKGPDRSVYLQAYWSSPSQPKELLRTPALAALPDTQPPSAIADLTAAAAGAGAAKLAFTAPGDDDVTLPGLSGPWGRAATYEVRYDTSPITAGSWDQAERADVYPYTSKAGQAETIAVDGLLAGTTYYFAVKGVDEAGQTGAISNVATATTSGTADAAAPGAVANLSAANPGLTTAQLNWTAPGDDGAAGTAAQYEVRFSTSAIDASNWSAATRAVGAPGPAAAGTAQSMTVQGLRPGQAYFFALRTADEAGHWSAISNAATLTTLAAPGGYIVGGASTMDLIVTPAESGQIYYAVYSSAQTMPTAASLKAAAQGSTGGSLVKNGVVPAQAGVEAVRTIGKLTDNATYYAYWVAEGATSGLGSVYSQTSTLQARQRLVQFTSPISGVGTVQYLLYMPEEAYRNPNGEFPTLLFLHGGGEEGTDAGKLTVHGPPMLIKNGQELPFIVISPQSKGTASTRWYTPDYTDQFVRHAYARYPADPDRLYVTGLSNGGGGAYYYAAMYPGKVAAVVPVAPQLKNHDVAGYPSLMTKALAIRLKDVPQWVFSNANDGTIVRDRVEEALRFAIGNPNPPEVSPLYTVYQVNGHSGWTETYNNPDIYEWMLQQSK